MNACQDQATPVVMEAKEKTRMEEQDCGILKERMNTKQAEYRTDIARLPEDNVKKMRG